VANISDPARAPDATLARIPEQKFCPDTEEVTGSNPVSPTKKALVSEPFCDLARACALGSVDLSAKLSAYRLASPSKSSLMARAPRVMTGRSSFRYTRSVTLVLPWPTKCAISSMVTPELDSKDTKLCRNSRGVHSLALSPAALATRRNERRTLAASSADPCRVQTPGPAHSRESPASRRIFICSAL
jgi:hypothetical protein